MKKQMNICSSGLINSYYDNELDSKERSEAEKHLESCRQCREDLEKYREISEYIHSEIQVPESSCIGLGNRVIDAVNHSQTPFLKRVERLLFSKKIFVPVGAMACLLVVFMTFFYNPAASGPSAIIQIASLSRDSGSVMILETPENRQTIIWFIEEG